MTPIVALTLMPEEAVTIVNILGQMPTNANIFPLWEKLRGQVEPQLNPVVSEAV